MTRPDNAWAYSELSKYVQYPGASHMDAAHHVLRYLRGTYDKAFAIHAILAITLIVIHFGGGWMLIGLEIQPLAAPTQVPC